MDMESLEKPVTMEDVVHEVAKLKGLLADAVEDGVRQAMRGIKRGRYAAEDALDEARHKVKQYPLEAIGIAFAAGMLVGGLACWGLRRR